MNNIKKISPDKSEIKTGTPGYKFENKHFVGGIGGNFIPGEVIPIKTGYVTTTNGIMTFHNITDSTSSIVDKLYITSTGMAEPDYSATSSGTILYYKCVDINFGTCTESTTDVELVGTFTGKSDLGSSVDYSEYAGIYTLVDLSKTGTDRQWTRTANGTTYYIYYNNDVGKWTAYTNTSEYGMTCSDNSGPFGTWFDLMNYVDIAGFSRWAVILTPPA